MKKILLLLLLSLPLAYAASAQGSFMAKYWNSANGGNNNNLFQPYLSLQVSRNVIWVMGHNQRMDSFYLMSVTPNGTVNFTRRWANRGFFYGTKATVSTSGMVFLLFLTPNEDTMSIWKLSPAGNVMVRKDYQTPTTVHFGDIAPTSDRGFLAGGGGCVGFHYFMCVDSNANVLWNKSYTQSSGFQSGAPLIIYKIESLDGGNKFRAFGGSTTGIFGMMDIDKSGPKSITYRKFDGFQNAAVLYTNVSRSAVRKDRYFMQIGSYPGPNTGTSVGTRTQVGNGFTMAYSDTLGNIKWTKRLDFPDTNIFWSQNFYSVPTRDGGVISVCNFGSMVSAYNPQAYNLYIKMDSLGNVVRQYAGSTCDTIGESIYAFTPIAGDTTFFVVNQTNAPGGISMGRVGHSLNTICKRRPYQCVVRNATLYAADETVDNLLQHTYTPIQMDANPYASIPAARQYYCADTVALRYNAVGALPQAGIRVYPNPAQGVLHIALPAGNGGATLMMLSATGQLAHAPLTLHTGDNVLDVSGMAAGIYVYRIVDGSGDYLNSGTVAVSGQQ